MIVCALVFVVLGSVLAELSNLPPRWYITVIIIIITMMCRGRYNRKTVIETRKYPENCLD
jgi:hypothetical protein